MFSVAGVRGIVGVSIRPDEYLRYVMAFGTMMGGGKIVVGCDSRISRHMLKHLAFSGLMAVGCDVLDIGLAPTPTVGINIVKRGSAGGIAITASHNPANWNAYKFFDEKGSFLSTAQVEELKRIAESSEFALKDYRELGVVSEAIDAAEIHLKAILPVVDIEAIRSRKFHVVVDCVNGVGGVVAEPLLEALGCRATFIYNDPTKEFPREPEPLPENLVELGEKVQEMKADVGFAIDPDADRLALVDELGNPMGEERTLILASASVLETGVQKNAVIVANLSTSRGLEDVAAAYGATLLRTPIGEAHVVGAIRENDAIIGGEGNGGVIYPKAHCGRDAATGMALILAGLARRPGLKLSDWNKDFPDYVMRKAKFDISDGARDQLETVIRATFSDAENFDTKDGVKVNYKDRWVHVRPSGTEPVMRVFAEARDSNSAKSLIEKAQAAFSVS